VICRNAGRWRRGAAALFALFLALGCDDEVHNPSSPSNGSLDITTTTSGVPSSSDGYSYILDGNPAQPIAFNTTIHLTNLFAGSHSIQLTALPDGCSLSSPNPVTVAVTSTMLAAAAFQVTCVVPSGVGNVQVTATTSDPSADNYALLLDTEEQGTIAANGTQALQNLSAGLHTVGMTSIPANCSLLEDNPQSVPVLSDSTVNLAFTVTCSAAPTLSGVLSITTTVTGHDADGFLVSIDGAKAQPLGRQLGATITNVAIGTHTVELQGLDGCVVTEANPVTVIVAAGENVSLDFTVSCSS
jgi:hypothetical protein